MEIFVECFGKASGIYKHNTDMCSVLIWPMLFAVVKVLLYLKSHAQRVLATLMKRLRNKEMRRNEISVVESMATRMLTDTYTACAHVAYGTICSLAMLYAVQRTVSIFVAVLGAALVLLLGLRYLLFMYRVQAGYYGSNVSEAREIIQFIHLHAGDLPRDNGGGGTIRIVSARKMTALREGEGLTVVGGRHA